MTPSETGRPADRRLLAFHAHPDDESSKGAATYSRLTDDGVHVLVVSATGGEAGDILNAGLEHSHPSDFRMAQRDMAGLRRHELQRARDVVGFDHRWLGYTDSGMPEDGIIRSDSFASIPIEISAEPLVRIIREFRPQVLVTYDENGGYPHPDHIRTHQVGVFALEAAADPAQYPDAGEPWQVSKLYYDRIFNASRFRAILAEIERRDPESPKVEELKGYLERVGDRPDLATTHIHCGDYFERRDQALRAHASQVAPDSTFFFWPNDVQADAWPYEDFQLVRSLVLSDLPEDDFFAGIPLNSEHP
ncbi:mycothiol conjugate amidase Mca [Cryobacterium sp. BB736]|uniref:mycothiol conjugate amidase Mca n=1 Tax=Cryobacterium sp. BB736 TaxID=2746963 RepID=UPI0018748A70